MFNCKTDITLRSVVNAISSTVDIVNDNLTRHHQRVAFISHMIGKEMGIPDKRAYDLILAAAMHDLGALSEDDDAGNLHNYLDRDVKSHAELGCMLLAEFKPLERVADIIKYHHHQWDYGKGHVADGRIVPFEGHIIHLADFVDLLINPEVYVLHQKDIITEIIKANIGNMFAPSVVDGFLKAFKNDYCWLYLDHLMLDEIIKSEFPSFVHYLTMDELIQFTKIISYLIDFRSPYTAFHSSGVAAVAKVLGCAAGMSENECSMLQIAGYLHDLGKLSIAPAVLNKEDKLTDSEYELMRSHSYHTYRILKRIRGFELVTEWASCHHERVDGSGYPFGLKGDQLSMGAKIVAVADVFSALTEERPYRKGMSSDDALALLKQMARESKLDEYVVGLLGDNVENIFIKREEFQNRALEEYLKVNKNIRIGNNGQVTS